MLELHRDVLSCAEARLGEPFLPFADDGRGNAEFCAEAVRERTKVRDRTSKKQGSAFPAHRGKKKRVDCVRSNQLSSKKISDTVLLSHSQIYSTIAAGGLNYRVREGNVCDSSALGAGKYSNEEK